MAKWPGLKRVGRGSFAVVFAFVMVFFPTCWAADPATAASEDQTPSELSLVVGKSVIIRSPMPVKRVSVAAPEIADFVLLSPTQIYLIGKTPGITNVTLWRNSQVSAVYDLQVVPDVSRLRQKLHQVLPGEKDLRVTPAHDSIILSGTISSTANLSQAITLASAYARKEKVINLLQVAGVHQVMLEVRVAEMSRSLAKRLGINFNVFREDEFVVNLLGSLTQLVEPDEGVPLTPGAPFGISASSAVNALFRFVHTYDGADVTWTGFIDALKEDGLVKILAEPTLIALSGQTASFLAGGEFPIPVPQGLGTVAIDYKTFGVALSFTPTVLSDDKIGIKVTPEASELDFSTAVLLEGFVVPGLTTRRATTVIELGDGQSFAIAGLLSETVRESISKFPILGEIPIIGTLFRSSSFQKKETELIIIVTPHLVKPLDLAKQSLPTDGFVEPNDIEFFLFGMLEGWREKTGHSQRDSLFTYLDNKGGLEGEFGHVFP